MPGARAYNLIDVLKLLTNKAQGEIAQDPKEQETINIVVGPAADTVAMGDAATFATQPHPVYWAPASGKQTGKWNQFQWS